MILTGVEVQAPVAADAGVQVHVVAAVGVDRIAPLGAFRSESSLDGDCLLGALRVVAG
jgi:hypothetical protein